MMPWAALGFPSWTALLLAAPSTLVSALVVRPKGCLDSLGLLGVADFLQHDCDETKQLVERVEAYCPVRCNVLHSALEPPSINIRFRSKLDNEGCLVLPSTHQEQTIVARAL